MALTNAYASTSQFRTFVGIPDNEDDARIELALNASSRQIDAHCGQPFWTTDAVTVRTFLSDGCRVLETGPIATTTGLIVATDPDLNGTFDTTLTINTDFIVEPINAAAAYPVQPYTSLRILGSSNAWFPSSVYGAPTVQVTARFGWASVPEDVEMACLLQARQLFKSADATFGAFSLGDSGISMRVRKMDQVAEGLLEPYRRVEC